MSELETQNASILVVDDEDVVVSLVRESLTEEGYRVQTASGAAEAIKLLGSHQFDLLITDIRMPEIDGIELAEIVRQMIPGISIIFMTGYANLNTAKDAIRQGAVDYILKPFELSEIREAVRKAIETQRQLEVSTSSVQLDRLSDLSSRLTAAADRETLIKVSLEFAMVHCQTQLGSVLWWDKNVTDVGMLTTDESHCELNTLPEDICKKCIHQTDWSKIEKPLLVVRREDHPFCGLWPEPPEPQYFIPNWFGAGSAMLLIPIRRTADPYGIMMVGARHLEAIDKPSYTKFLSISADQLAMSLENLDLLKESQQAYSRLKELQDQTIELETMATRGKMSAEIGHELNNFVGVVAGNLSLLENHIKNEKYDKVGKHVSAMYGQIQNIKKFTSNLMDFSQTSSRQEATMFDQILDEVLEYLKPQKRFRNVAIELSRLDSPLPFKADTMHIQQLLYNLFNNAADATANSAERQIAVSAVLDDKQDNFIFEISDTGEGIEPELLNRAFNERFTTKKDGHGFGLIVCKRIIDAHGGKLEVQSSPGQGTTIQITFPTCSQTSPQPAPA